MRERQKRGTRRNTEYEHANCGFWCESSGCHVMNTMIELKTKHVDNYLRR